MTPPSTCMQGLNMEEFQACGKMRVVSTHVTTGVKAWRDINEMPKLTSNISWSQLVQFVIFLMCKWVYSPKKRKSSFVYLVQLLKKLPLRFGQALINSCWQLINIGVNLSIITHWLLLFISTLSLGILCGPAVDYYWTRQ